MTIQGMDAPTDEVGGSLGHIRWHPMQVEHHRVLFPNRQYRFDGFVEVLRAEHHNVMPTIGGAIRHGVMMRT